MSVDIKKNSYKGQKGSAVNVSIDATDQLVEIERMLGDLSKKAPNTLKNAVNGVAGKMRTRMANQAKKTYVLGEMSRTGGEKPNYKDAIIKKNATISTLTAKLQVSGKGGGKYLRRNALSKFDVSPEELAHGKNRPNHYGARVLQSSTPKRIGKNNLKAFLVQFKSGHIALVQRDPSQQYEEKGYEERMRKYGMGADMSRIVEKRGPSVSEMLGSRRVYGVVEPEIGSLLQFEVEKFVQKTIERGAKK